MRPRTRTATPDVARAAMAPADQAAALVVSGPRGTLLCPFVNRLLAVVPNRDQHGDVGWTRQQREWSVEAVGLASRDPDWPVAVASEPESRFRQNSGAHRSHRQRVATSRRLSTAPPKCKYVGRGGFLPAVRTLVSVDHRTKNAKSLISNEVKQRAAQPSTSHTQGRVET